MATSKGKAKRVLIEQDAKGQLAGDARDAVIMATENTTQKIGTLYAAMEFSEDWWSKQEAADLIDRWERHVRAKLSERTWKRYRALLLEFAAYLEGDLTRGGEVVYKRNRPDQISHLMTAKQKDVVRWMDYLHYDRLTVDRRNPKKPRTYKSLLGASSRKTALAALRSFYKWARSLTPELIDPSEHVEPDPVKTEKGGHLSKDEMNKLLTWNRPRPKKKPKTPEAGALTNVMFARERVIVWLLAYTGLRAQELVDLKWVRLS